jgi:PAS domain S-box-containing protein
MLSEHLDTTNKKVLVIDDDAAVRMLARASLEQYSLSVFEAVDGAEGLEEFKTAQPDIILLDVVMPGMNGFEVCSAVRGLPGGDNVPIIMMTGCDDLASINRAFRSGATEFLTKPINWMTLPYHVRYVIRSSTMFDKLQQSEQQNSVILQTLPDQVLYVKNDGTIIRKNRQSVFDNVLSVQEKERQNILDIYPADFGRRLMETIKNGMVHTREQVFEYSYGNDGNLKHYEVRIVKSSLEECLVVIRDNTAQMKAIQQTKQTKEYLEAIIKNSVDGIIVTDSLGNITAVNPAVAKMFKCRGEELIGKHLVKLAGDDAERIAEIRNKMPALFENGWASFELLLSRMDGTQVEVECNTALVKNEAGEVLSSVNSLRDITERKKLDAHLLQSEKMRALGELSAGVAHDFNNILAIIIGRCQMLKKSHEYPLFDEKRKTMIELITGLDIIEKAALDGAETVSRIQQFSKKDKDNKNYIAIDINKLLHDVVEYTRAVWETIAQQKGVSFSVIKNFSPVAPVSGHPSQLREVYINLIKNAIEAMPDGGTITIETFMDNNNVAVKVRDSGRGMPAEIQERIFDPFFTTKGSQSTGLGLSISYGIINRHYGTITVDSLPGKGTTFSIYLPQAGEVKKAEEVAKKDEVSASSGPARILIIDDEEEIRGLLQEIVAADGHVVDIAPDGKSGLEKMDFQHYDLVFTDVGMPGLSGWDVAKKVKEMNQKTPVALITGYHIYNATEELQEKGVDFILYKPFHIAEVQQLIAQGIQLRDRLAYN